MEKIIDFEKSGNVIRFYCGSEDCNDYWGDDRDDKPYEHNAGRVYSEYVTNTFEVAFPLGVMVCEPADDWHYRGNSPYSKESFIKQKAPCIVIIPEDVAEEEFAITYGTALGDKRCFPVYFNQPVNSDFMKDLERFGAVLVRGEPCF